MTDQQTPNPRLHGWHLDKRVSLGHIVTTLTVAIGVVIYLMRLEATIQENRNALETEIEQRQEMDRLLEARLTRTEDRIASTLQDIRDAIVRIEDKMDNKADRSWSPQRRE